MSSRVHGGLNIMMRSALRITEARELAADQEAELAELVGIYRQGGVPEPLAQQVARALHDADPLGAHLRDELGHSDITAARPLQAATASAQASSSAAFYRYSGC
jgi:VIT1/CCC1 family predicted Fe2+/Mn2+ transporter